MKKKLPIVLSIVGLLLALNFLEISKVGQSRNTGMPTLDDLHTDEVSKNWEPFYKVRATIVDGRSAEFSIPQKIKDGEGKELTLSGALVFFGNGCRLINDSTTEVTSFFLLPSLGLAQACVLQPDVAMRWTIRVNLLKPWVVNRNEMINAEATVSGILKIDTSKPYEAAFILEQSVAALTPKHD